MAAPFTPAPRSTTLVDPTPSLGWRVFVVVGVGGLALLSASDAAWRRWERAAPFHLPRAAPRAVVGATAAVHLAEAAWVVRAARREGVDRPGRWARATLAWGFPVPRRLAAARAAGQLAA